MKVNYTVEKVNKTFRPCLYKQHHQGQQVWLLSQARLNYLASSLHWDTLWYFPHCKLTTNTAKTLASLLGILIQMSVKMSVLHLHVAMFCEIIHLKHKY